MNSKQDARYFRTMTKISWRKKLEAQETQLLSESSKAQTRFIPDW